MRRLALTFCLPLVAVALFAFRAAQEAAPVLPATPLNYAAIVLPAHLQQPLTGLDNTPVANPVTNAGATLGRVLFYDKRLSQNQTISCASCHGQARAFSDNVALSLGFNGGHTGRNSMALSFARFYPNGKYFWDERVATLEAQTLMPIQDGVEMGMTLPELVTRLQATSFYPALFRDAFGTTEITSDRVSRALAQFVRSMVAPNSRYDQARAASPPGPPGAPLTGLTASENRGLGLFFGRAACAACHTGELQAAVRPFNNGLDATVTDGGADGQGRFKVGSLRNVALTAPYMHDGRFQTLDQVVDFYDRGVQNNPFLDAPLRGPGGGVLRPGLNPQDRADLVAFLNTLTDASFTTDVRWSDPFTNTTAAEGRLSAGAPTLTLAGPNPVRTSTTLRIALPTASEATVTVYDVQGRAVSVLTSGAHDTGAFTVAWQTGNVAPGVYLARLVTAGRVATLPLTVVR